MFQSTVASSADGLKRPTDRGRADCSSLTGGGKAKNFTGFALLSTELFPLKGWRFQNIRKFLMKCPGPGRIAASLFRLRLAARICFRNSRSRPPVPTEQGCLLYTSELDIFRKNNINAEFCNQNAFLDENKYTIIKNNKKYNACLLYTSSVLRSFACVSSSSSVGTVGAGSSVTCSGCFCA